MVAWLFVCLCWFGWCWFGLVVGFDAGCDGLGLYLWLGFGCGCLEVLLVAV